MTTTTAVTTAAHKTFFGRLIASIGGFLGKLLNAAKTAWNSLTPQQQQEIISGVNISQIIKDGYTKGEDFIIQEISSKTALPTELVTPIILTALKDMQINVTSVQAGLNALADKVQAGLTDNGWNALWQNLAKFSATAVSGGGLNWVGLSLGLVEFAFQHFIKAKQ